MRSHLSILRTNYGEAGPVNLHGPNYGLPRAISGINSFWYGGYKDPRPHSNRAWPAVGAATWAGRREPRRKSLAGQLEEGKFMRRSRS